MHHLSGIGETSRHRETAPCELADALSIRASYHILSVCGDFAVLGRAPFVRLCGS